jgi:hypothetical protein
MSAPSSAKPTTQKRVHPILQLPERFQNLSVQFGKEPQLTEINADAGAIERNRVAQSVNSAIQQRTTLTPDNNRLPTDFTLTPPKPTADLAQPTEGTPSEPPFRLYDLVKLDPALFWELYHARAYNDLLIVLAYERFLLEEKKGKTNYIETIHLTGTSFEPAKSNGLEFWHSVEDGTDNGLVELKPDPDNTHDANAIRVLTTSTKKQIGWIPAKDQINQLVSRNCHLGCFNSAQLLKVEPNAGKSATIGIQIAIGWAFPADILEKYT